MVICRHQCNSKKCFQVFCNEYYSRESTTSTAIPFLGARIYGLDRIFVYYCYSYIYFKNIQKAFVIVVDIFILKLF